MLNHEQIQQLHAAVLELLERTGVRVDHPEAVTLLQEAGAKVNGKRIRIPPRLVEDATKVAPKRVAVHDRRGHEALVLEGRRLHFGANTDCPNILDGGTGQRRPFLKEDGRHAAVVCDALAHIEFVLPCGLYSDVPSGIADRVAIKQMFQYTTKPVLLTCWDATGLSDAIEMAAVIAGGSQPLRQAPFVMTYSEPISPLTHSQVGLDKALLSVRTGIPLVYTPMPLCGSTAPATLAGTLVTAIAEVLSGLVIAQLANKGAPFIVGGVTTIMDMSTMVCAYGAPEMHLLPAAWAEMAHHYELPIFSTAGCSNSKLLDEQAIAESSISCLTAALAGANLVHDIGLLESAMTLSLELIVVTNEILGMVKRIAGGIDISKETLALDVIDHVGPGGEFVSTDHTSRHFRESWFPQILDRANYQRWCEKGGARAGQRANEQVKEIIGRHKPTALPADVTAELDRMERRWTNAPAQAS